MPRRARAATVHPIALRELEVLRVTDVTPGMRRVTLTGAQLDAHTSADGFAQRAFVSDGFDDDVRLIFAYPGQNEPVLPILKDGGMSWPRDPRPLSRAYTVRRFDPATRELDVDFVKHGVGVATTWAYRTQPGERVHLAGPSVSSAIPTGFDWFLVLGDETALPAIGRLLEELPSDARAQVFIEVAHEEHRQELVAPAGAEITWLAPADVGSAVLQAVRAATWWDGSAFAWVAGESAVVRDVRRHLVEDRGLAKESIDFSGYWKQEEVVALEADPSVPDPEKNEKAYEKFHDQAEILPPLAIRVAVDLKVGDLVSRGVNTPAGLAERTGTHAGSLAKFLRYLESIELLTSTDGVYALSESGEFLTNEYVVDYLRSDGISARRQRAFEGLENSLRTGAASYSRVTGSEFAAERRDDAFERRYLDDVAEYADYETDPLARLEVFTKVAHVVVHSDAAVAVANSLTAAHPEIKVTIAALPAHARWLATELPTTVPEEGRRARIDVVEQSVFEAAPSADLVLVHGILDQHPDADAALVLQRAAASSRVLLVQESFDESELDEHDAEADLLALTLHGSGHRTAGELEAVVAASGLRVTSSEVFGWGSTARVLVS